MTPVMTVAVVPIPVLAAVAVVVAVSVTMPVVTVARLSGRGDQQGASQRRHRKQFFQYPSGRHGGFLQGHARRGPSPRRDATVQVLA
jgi:3-deoxy-D-arabino-heptulosonate 7-phosphate (DAHP) synthase class II